MLCRYTEQGASSRLRSMQFVPGLERRGFDIQVHSLFNDQYLRYLYGKKPLPVSALLGAYLRRMSLSLRSRYWDVVWVEKEILPWLPAWLERLLLANARALVLDYDDAIFHRYDQHPSRWVTQLLGTKISRMMRRADLVIAGSPYLADYADSAGARWVELVPTSVDIRRYSPAAPDITHSGCPGNQQNRFVLGWIGTPHTARYLQMLSEVFQQLNRTGPMDFHFIGAPEGLDLGIDYKARTWNEQTEVSELQKLDCGIMPLQDSPFEQGKCGYKILQYFACGIPAVASPVGVNQHIICPGENGYLAAQTVDWVRHINELRCNPERRQKMGQQGRTLVEQRYATSVALNAIEGYLRQLS